MSDNLTNNQDLLDILEASIDSSEDNTQPKTQDAIDEEESDKKLNEIHDIANQMVSGTGVGNNPGSGDLDEDLSNWFNGKSQIPSDELNNYTSNLQTKMDYGLTRNILSSYTLMGKLRKFIEEDAFDMVFSEQAIMGLDSDEIETRVRTAFTMYERLASLNAKINLDMRNYRLKANTDSTDIDKLTLLLGSIPSEKLTKVLEEISYSNSQK